jgi:hypothetical protein
MFLKIGDRFSTSTLYGLNSYQFSTCPGALTTKNPPKV